MKLLDGDRTGLRFALVLAAFAAAAALLFREEIVGPLVVPLRVLTARGALALIQLSGMEAVREASAIYHPGGFAYEMSRGCIGLVPAGFLIVGVLAYPGPLKNKVTALILAVPLLFAVNMTRLVHLFYLGVHRADLFHVAHRVVWQIVIVLAVFTLWLAATHYLESRGRPSRSPG
jgi:exosortase/archaeosortase family protein